MSIKLFFLFVLNIAANLPQSPLAAIEYQSSYKFENNAAQSCEMQFRFLFADDEKQENKQVVFDNFFDQTSVFLSTRKVEAIGTFFIGPSTANDPETDLVLWRLNGSCGKNKKQIFNFIEGINKNVVQYHAFQNTRPLSDSHDLIFIYASLQD